LGPRPHGREIDFLEGGFLKQQFGRVIALTVLALALLPSQGFGETIVTQMFYDGFEGDTANILDSSLVNWNVVSGSVDVLGAGNLCGPSGDSSHCVDLDGTGIVAGTIQTKQSFALDPGIYRLSFDLAGANRDLPGAESNTVTVTLGSYFSEDFTLSQWDPFTTFTRDIEIADAGTGTIGFQHYGNDWIGLLLDNVTLSELTIVPDIPDIPGDPNDPPVPTPEPGSMTLLLSAVGIMVWHFRKKDIADR
jgi:hypothetical protein